MTKESKEYCLYCKRSILEVLPESNQQITFYRCPICNRQFACRPGYSLTERWGGSISRVLYGTIFSPKPQEDAQRLATIFRNRESKQELAQIIVDIRDKIAQPRQRVRDIHGQAASEEDLREFLTLFADILTSEAKTLLRTLKGHTSWVRALAFSPDGQVLASGSADSTIKLRNPLNGRFLHTLTGHTGIVFAVAISPDGETLTSGGQDGTIRLWDLKTGRLLKTLEGHTGWVRALAFSPDGQMLASGSTDTTVRVWDTLSGQQMRSLTGHRSAVLSVVVRPDGQVLVSGGEDGTMRMWNAQMGTLIRTLTGHVGAVHSLAIINNGQFPVSGHWLASGSEDATVRLWSADDGRFFTTYTGHTAPVRSVAFNAKWDSIFSDSEDTSIKEWNIYVPSNLIHTLPGHSGIVYSVVVSPDGQLIASGSQSIKIRGKK